MAERTLWDLYMHFRHCLSLWEDDSRIESLAREYVAEVIPQKVQFGFLEAIEEFFGKYSSSDWQLPINK